MNNTHCLHTLFQVSHIIFGTHMFEPLQNSIVFVCIKVSKRSSFEVVQYKTKREVDFDSKFEFVIQMIPFLVEEWVVEGWRDEIKHKVSSFFKLRFIEEMIARIEILF